jgi:adenosine deaminase
MNENFHAMSFTREQALQVSRNAFTISWLDDGDKRRYLDALEEYAG